MVSYRGGYRPKWTTGSFATCSRIGKTALRIACICLNQADPSTLQRGTLRVLQHGYTRSSIQRRITFLFPPDVMSNAETTKSTAIFYKPFVYMFFFSLKGNYLYV